MNHAVRATGLTALALALAACTGPEERTKRSVAELLLAGDYASAARAIEERKDEYGPSNYVLYHLDLGLTLHYAGRHEQSARSLEAAETRLEALYTKSASAAAGRLIANENIKDYRGQPSDRALGHIFNALNYVFLGKPDEALVEVRRLEADLEELGRAASGARSYTDDAFAHYLAALLYADSGKADDARISHESARKAYARQSTAPPSAPPPAVAEGVGELVFLHYNGPAPRKISVSAGVILPTAYPKYIQDPFRVAGSELEAGEEFIRTELYSDISAIVDGDLRDDLNALKKRSALRATLKLVQQAATGVDASASEFADVRSCSAIPAQIRLARLALKPGVYRPTVRYRDAAGKEVFTRTLPEIRVDAGRRVWMWDKTGS